MQRSAMKSAGEILAAAVAMTLVGCAGSHELETATVRGLVTIDGSPLKSGMVYFNPMSGRGARGEIRSDGSFELTTYQDGDGAIVGEHKVFVIAIDEAATAIEATGPVKSLVPPKYKQPRDIRDHR